MYDETDYVWLFTIMFWAMTRILSMNHIVVSHLKTPTIRNKPRDAIDDHLIHYEFKKKKQN